MVCLYACRLTFTVRQAHSAVGMVGIILRSAMFSRRDYQSMGIPRMGGQMEVE